MVKLWILPIEAQPMRYSNQWREMFWRECDKHGIKNEFVGGLALKEKPKKGEVFDPFTTSIYKVSQMQSFLRLWKAGKVKQGDVVLDLDFWHPSVETIAYIKSMENFDLKYYALAHAGTYDDNDFTHRLGMEYFGKGLEMSWLAIAEKIFVGSTYHKAMLERKRGVYNVVNTGFPIDYENLRVKATGEKKDIVVWTSRLAPEKGLEEMKMIRAHVKNMGKQFIVTQEVKFVKDEYYQLLSQAKVVLSTAKQETFGIGTLEAMALGCTPVVPDGLSYTDYVPERMRYKNTYQALELVKTYLENPVDVSENVAIYGSSIERMFKEMELI